MTDTMENVAAPEWTAPTTTPLIGVVVVTHGQLATELLNAAEMIVGDLPQFAAVSIGWHDDVETAKEAIAAAITHVVRPAGVIDRPHRHVRRHAVEPRDDVFPAGPRRGDHRREPADADQARGLAAVVESTGGRPSDSRRWPQRHLGRIGFDAKRSLRPLTPALSPQDQPQRAQTARRGPGGARGFRAARIPSPLKGERAG
jgi:hypothetical protein